MAWRISIVMGKGGVGKTTVAAALARDLAARGERVLLVSSWSTAEVLNRLESEAGDPALGGRLTVHKVSERQLVDDYVVRITRMGPMAEMVLRHPAYESFIEIVPGIRELALLNFIYETQQDPDSRYDRIVVDAPATGHGVHVLEAPEKSRALLVGKLRERADAIESMLEDADRTEVVLVTLPEEIPVRETLELAERVRGQGFHLDNLVVNRWMPTMFVTEGSSRLLDRLNESAENREALTRAVSHRSRVDVEQAVAAMSLVREERREGVHLLQELLHLDLKLSLVPTYRGGGVDLKAVADALRATVDPEEVEAA